jgi:hypothetical protein
MNTQFVYEHSLESWNTRPIEDKLEIERNVLYGALLVFKEQSFIDSMLEQALAEYKATATPQTKENRT